MSAHRCDDWTRPDDTPLTRARVRRLVAAAMERDEAGVTSVLTDLNGCPDCTQAALVMAASVAAHTMPEGDLRALIALDLRLDAADEES